MAGFACSLGECHHSENRATLTGKSRVSKLGFTLSPNCCLLPVDMQKRMHENRSLHANFQSHCSGVLMRRWLLICFILLIPVGAGLGIFHPLYQAMWSGEDVRGDIPVVRGQARFDLTPEMNTSRLFAKIRYHRRSGNIFLTNVYFDLEVEQEGEAPQSKTVSFGVDREETTAVDGVVVLAIEDFDVTQNRSVIVHITPQEHEYVSIQSVSFQLRRNVSEVNVSIVVAGCLVMLVGILGTVFMGVRMVFASQKAFAAEVRRDVLG